jgi:alkanesulfonate monooxygenase SsuD/methylene tetrahydromethanopterin reductase-like flavin-dependent oxidoreductase (luciferase family)
MICALVIAADTDEMAQYHFSSLQITMIERVRGHMGPLRRPVPSLDSVSTPDERKALERFLPHVVVGSRARVFGELDRLISETAADELIALTLVHDQVARHRSFEILAEHDAFALG